MIRKEERKEDQGIKIKKYLYRVRYLIGASIFRLKQQYKKY